VCERAPVYSGYVGDRRVDDDVTSRGHASLLNRFFSALQACA